MRVSTNWKAHFLATDFPNFRIFKGKQLFGRTHWYPVDANRTLFVVGIGRHIVGKMFY